MASASAGALGPADGVSPLPPAPGEEPGPREGPPWLFGTTPGPALPRAPAAGVGRRRTAADDQHRADPGRRDRRRRAGREGVRMPHDAMPAGHAGRAARPREARRAELARARRHGRAMRQPGGRAVGAHLEHVLAEAGYERDQRQHAGEQGRGQLAALALAAGLALVDVPADPLAQQRRHLPVPPGQQAVERRAVAAAGARDDQRAEGPLQLAAGPGLQRVGVVAGHPERVGQFVVVQPLHQAELDDVLFAGVQPVDRVPDELMHLGPLDRAGHVDRFGCARVAACGGGHVHRLVECGRGLPRPPPAVALVPRDRVQPGPELARIAEAAELGRGDEERVLHGVGGVLGLTQQGAAVGVQRHRVRVVRLGDAARVARHDGGDDLPVLHRRHRSSPAVHQAA